MVNQPDNGTDSFTFKVNDGTVDSNIATVTITVTVPNQEPVVKDQSIGTITLGDQPAIILSATD